MSDTSQGPGWWLASDGRWYPPESLPDWAGQAHAASGTGPIARPEDTLASWAPVAATPMDAPLVMPYPNDTGYAGPAGFQPLPGLPYPQAGQPVIGTTS